MTAQQERPVVADVVRRRVTPATSIPNVASSPSKPRGGCFYGPSGFGLAINPASAKARLTTSSTNPARDNPRNAAACSNAALCASGNRTPTGKLSREPDIYRLRLVVAVEAEIVGQADAFADIVRVDPAAEHLAPVKENITVAAVGPKEAEASIIEPFL